LLTTAKTPLISYKRPRFYTKYIFLVQNVYFSPDDDFSLDFAVASRETLWLKQHDLCG
jgi:hypothetical protein